MSLNTLLALRIEAALTRALDLGGPSYPLEYTYRKELESGVGADQADKLFTDTRTLAPSASEVIDLVTAGALTDALGDAVAFTKVKALIIAAAAGNVNDLLVGGAASNGFISWVGAATDVVKIRPGGMLALVAPGLTAYAVVSGTAESLKITNGGAGTSVTYDIIVIGTSA